MKWLFDCYGIDIANDNLKTQFYMLAIQFVAIKIITHQWKAHLWLQMCNKHLLNDSKFKVNSRKI